MPPAPPSTEARKKPPPPPAKDKTKPEAAKPEAGRPAPGKTAGKQPAETGKPGGAATSRPPEPAKQGTGKQTGARTEEAVKAGDARSAADKRIDRLAVRAKMAVSAPGDAVEREADHVADKVMRSLDGEESGAVRNTNRDPEPPSISRQPADDAAKNPAARPTVPADFAKDLGSGMPIDAANRARFERQFGRDFSAVRIHADAKADSAAKQIGARAFTLGENIAFAAGEYEPDTPEGQRLLAHELTHVVQQGDGVTRMVMRANGSGGGGGTGGGSGNAEFIVNAPLQIPPIKARHASTYQLLAGQNRLRRPKAYSAETRGTNQRSNWLGQKSKIDLGGIPAKHKTTSGSWLLPLQGLGGAKGLTLTASNDAELKDQLIVPAWDKDGVNASFDVDHMVEIQVGGEDGPTNYELLKSSPNRSVGGSLSREVKNSVKAELVHYQPPSKKTLPPVPGVTTMPTNPTPDFVLTNYEVVFKTVQGRDRESKTNPEAKSQFWTTKELLSAQTVTQLLPNTPESDLKGTAKSIALLSPTGNLLITRLPFDGTNVSVPKGGRDGIAGFTIEAVTLTVPATSLTGATAVAEGTSVGQVEGKLDLGSAVTIDTTKNYALPLQKATNDLAVKIGSGAPPAGSAARFIPATFTPLSPMEISDITISRGVYAKTLVRPTHPALAGIEIPGQVRNGEVGIFHTVDVTQLTKSLNVPGLTVDGASITIGYNGKDVSVAGNANFTIRNFGQGELTAKLDSSKRFELEGGFRADPRLFDQADMKMWYRSEEGFGAKGTLAITNPNKIRGIKSASVNASYQKGVFHADGSVQPNLPGVENVGLSVTYGPDASGATSLSIAGDVKLAAGIPGISGGDVHVTLVQKDDAWKVSASGSIKPNLPLEAPAITINYDDGLFDGKASAGFNKGIFSGKVDVGLTNRAVTPEGKLSGTEPGTSLTLYGGGSVTARITEHLQGGVGLQVRPDGTVLISGKIGIPAAVTVFDQYPAPGKDRRSLLTLPTLAIPLVGAPGAGVSLNITGGVEGYAHIGPGKLTSAEISVQDFNPAQPDSLKISGKGAFNVPAEAGVDAAMQAGLSAGAVISLEAGVKVTAGVAAEAKVTPQVDIDWTPSAGLHLHAELAASVTPKLRFGVNGYVSVLAGAFGVNYELWRKDWQLAEKEAGSNLSIGITVPVDYYSDSRGIVFDPNQVTFQVPSLDVDTLRGLLNDNGTETVERG